jgi:hypothetical protein
MPDGSQKTEVKRNNPDGSVSIITTIKETEETEQDDESSEQEESESDGEIDV